MRHPNAAWMRRRAGFSLVELMVAMVLGLVVVAGVGQIYVSNKQTYRVTEAVARIQENARFAMDMLARDLRAAGYWDCGGAAAQIANSVNGTGWQYVAEAVYGYEGGVDNFPADYSGDVLQGTDSFRVAYMDASRAHVVDSHNPSAATIQLTADHDLKQGEVLAVASPACKQVGIFQMSNTNNNNTIKVVVHNTGASTSPGNCTKDLGGAFTCSDQSNATTFTYEPGSRLMRFVSRAYYVSTGAGGTPALYRIGLSHASGNASLDSEELVEGVEDMQVLYGVDTDSDDTANLYVTADLVPSVGEWSDVVSVRVDLLMRSLEDRLTSETRDYVFHGEKKTPADRRIRRVFTLVVALRNRLP